MKKHRERGILWRACICVVFVLSASGCNYKEIEDGLHVKADQIGNELEKIIENPGGGEERDSLVQVLEDGSLFFETGPEKTVDYSGNVNFIVTKAVFYENPEAAGVALEDVSNEHRNAVGDAAFMLVDMTVENIDYPGTYSDGSMNLSMFYLRRNDSGSSYGLPPVYVDMHGAGDAYWHIAAEPGEKTEIKLGYSLPVSTKEEAEEYKIGFFNIEGACAAVPME